MHIRINFSSIINIFIQVIFLNIITYLDRTFKDEQNDIKINLVYILILFTKSVMPKWLTKIINKRMH